jgi:hypothetical protein
MKKFTAISYEGGITDKRLLAILATVKGIPMGRLVRQAVESEYKHELADLRQQYPDMVSTTDYINTEQSHRSERE